MRFVAYWSRVEGLRRVVRFVDWDSDGGCAVLE